MVRVKICGITNLEDAFVALEAGADYLGFVLYPPSPRSVSADQVAAMVLSIRQTAYFAAIIPERDAPQLVGVFVNERPEAVAAMLARCGLDLAQLSGDEEATQVTEPMSLIVGRSYKSIRPQTDPEARLLASRYAVPGMWLGASLPQLLVDTPHRDLYGGSGHTGEWSISAGLARDYPRLMLAGGLTPENVEKAVSMVRPYAVDVASGVEQTPGRKDHARVKAFITRAKCVRASE